jgi:hypothetical protein
MSEQTRTVHQNKARQVLLGIEPILRALDLGNFLDDDMGAT